MQTTVTTIAIPIASSSLACFNNCFASSLFLLTPWNISHAINEMRLKCKYNAIEKSSWNVKKSAIKSMDWWLWRICVNQRRLMSNGLGKVRKRPAFYGFFQNQKAFFSKSLKFFKNDIKSSKQSFQSIAPRQTSLLDSHLIFLLKLEWSVLNCSM